MSEINGNKARSLSVANLQRVYTIVVSLAITESLRRWLTAYGDTGQLPTMASTVAVISLLFTVVPFYHGANRYLEATYVTNERKSKHGTLMLDFLALFFEGIIFFVLAMLIGKTDVFFTILGGLFIFDALWVWFTDLTLVNQSDKVPNFYKWASINVISACGIFISIWSNLLNLSFWRFENAQVIAVGGIAVLRTIYDYKSVWKFYYPPVDQELLPAPRPAPIPKGSQSRE
jgi:hypothetical protein